MVERITSVPSLSHPVPEIEKLSQSRLDAPCGQFPAAELPKRSPVQPCQTIPCACAECFSIRDW